MKYVENRKFLGFDKWIKDKARLLAEDLAKLIISCVKDSIKEKQIIATGSLLESWSKLVESKGQLVFEVKVASASPYWRVVEEGFEKNPSFSKIPPLITWIKEKVKRGQFPSIEDERDMERLAWAIAITHSKQGMKGRGYIESAIKKFSSRSNIIMYNWTQKYTSGK